MDIKTIKKKANNAFPKLAQLTLSEEHWQKIFYHLKDHKMKRFSSVSFLIALAEVMNLPYETVIEQLSNKNSSRNCKIKTSTTSTQSFPSTRRKKRIKGENTLAYETHQDNALESPLIKTGVHKKTLIDAAPTKGYPVKKTPNGTRYKRIFENPHATLFQPESPQKKTCTAKKKLDYGNLLPNMHYRKLDAKPFQFTATLQKIQNTLGTSRRQTQHQLTGVRCQDIFIVEGHDNAIEMKGQQFHWSHIIAYFLGGKHDKNNLFPATAASNYNMLDVIEQFIANQLSTQKTTSILITATPSFTDKQLIPDTLDFLLEWEETQNNLTIKKQEIITIYPQSHSRVNSKMLSSITSLRN